MTKPRIRTPTWTSRLGGGAAALPKFAETRRYRRFHTMSHASRRSANPVMRPSGSALEHLPVAGFAGDEQHVRRLGAQRLRFSPGLLPLERIADAADLVIDRRVQRVLAAVLLAQRRRQRDRRRVGAQRQDLARDHCQPFAVFSQVSVVRY